MNSLMLYHHPLSVCSMKVRLALEEKGLAWSGRVIDIVHQQEQLEPWYLKLNPKGVVPTLEYRNGSAQIITDSATIIRFIANLPSGNSLIPANQNGLELLIDRADRIDLQILSYARHPSPEKSKEILVARVQKAKLMAEQLSAYKSQYQVCAKRSEANLQLRVDKAHISTIEKDALSSIELLDTCLKDKRFLMGNDYSLADVIWTVVLSRLDLLGYDEWVRSDRFPALAEYYQRVQQRKSYELAQIQNQWWAK